MSENINKIVSIINDRRIYYFKEYGKYPEYVKVPLWVYRELKDDYKKTITCANLKEESFMIYNMQICKTDSIYALSQIEVF